MTPEEKELLKDLSARQIYRVKILCEGWDSDHGCEFNTVEELVGIDDRFIYTLWRGERDKHSIQEPCSIIDYKPYLRSMSSMTEEEIDEFTQFDVYADGEYVIPNYKAIDWLNKNMFDYRGLIPKGLAIEVNESNNPYKIKVMKGYTDIEQSKKLARPVYTCDICPHKGNLMCCHNCPNY